MIMAEVESVDEFGKPKIEITSDKSKSKFIIYKSNDGFAHFKVKYDKGVIPKELSGAYTGLGLARDAVFTYERGMNFTKKARTEKYYEENH